MRQPAYESLDPEETVRVFRFLLAMVAVREEALYVAVEVVHRDGRLQRVIAQRGDGPLLGPHPGMARRPG